MSFFHDCDPDERFHAWDVIHSIDPVASEWFKYDTNTRRCIAVKVEGGDPDGDISDEILTACINDIDRHAVRLTATVDGAVLSTSSDPNHDPTVLPAYPALNAIPLGLRERSVPLDTLVELERLGPWVDLVTDRSVLQSSRDPVPKYVFKWHLHWKEFIKCWHEMNCMARLLHPNIVSFDRLVTAKCGPDDQDRIVGFTMEFVPGGTFEQNQDRVFKLKYLHQLISVVDDLNLRLGIIHQDVAPDNVALDLTTDNIKLFDFGFSAKLGWEGYEDNFHFFRDRGNRDDVKGVVFTVYEIITRDWQYSSKPLSMFPLSKVLETPWTRHELVQLDRDVQEYQTTLREWTKARMEQTPPISHYTQLPEHLDWPLLEAPDLPIFSPQDGAYGLVNTQSRLLRSRREARKRGERYLSWERPAHDQIPSGCCVLASGEVV